MHAQYAFAHVPCTATAPVVTDEPAITVHSSDKDIAVGDEYPSVEELPAAQCDSVPLVDRMVCVQAHRSSHTAPFSCSGYSPCSRGNGHVGVP